MRVCVKCLKPVAFKNLGNLKDGPNYQATCPKDGPVDTIFYGDVTPSLVKECLASVSPEPAAFEKSCKKCGETFVAKRQHHRFCPKCLPSVLKRANMSPANQAGLQHTT